MHHQGGPFWTPIGGPFTAPIDNGGSAKLLFVGDAAQLEPVGETASPALSEDYLRTVFGLRVGSAELTKVVRQAADSPVLERASELRDAIRDERFNRFSLRPDGADIEEVEASRAIDLIEESIRSRTTIVTVVPSNAMALEYNRAVRERLWGRADVQVQPRDTLLVNKNSRSFDLSNGDLVKVVDVAPEAERVAVAVAGKHIVELHFREATVAYRAPDGAVIQTSCLLLENPCKSARGPDADRHEKMLICNAMPGSHAGACLQSGRISACAGYVSITAGPTPIGSISS